MKKLFIFISVLFLMSGCDEATDTLSCTSTSTANGVITRTTYDIKYSGDDVKHVMITNDYSQDTTNQNNNDTMDGINADTDGISENGNNDNDQMESDNGIGSQDTANQNNNDTMDGINADTDGTSEDNNTNNRQMESDDVIDGVVGDTIDGIVGGVTDTILDIAGIRNTYENQMRNFDNIEGFSYNVDVDNDNEYRVVYEIDMDKISDDDLNNFNDVTRDFSDFRDNYEDLGYTCK